MSGITHLFKKTVVQHIIFWVLYFTFNVVRWGFYFDDFSYSFQSNLVEFSVHLLLVYFNIYYLIPRYLPLRRIGTYSFLIIGAITLLSIVRILLTYALVTTDIWREANLPEIGLFNPNYVVAVIVGELYVVAFTASIKLGIDWAQNLQSTKELENKRLEAELAFLRSQIQPHFFFNTLNNLYYLTLSKSDQAPETVLKLADLMSYVIYKGRLNRVSLLDEIGHVQDYIDLERLRYGERLELNFNISGNVEDKYIPPLILLPFVENSFKHGGIDDTKVLPINIDVMVEDHTLTYSVENLRRVEVVKSDTKMLERTGIGIANTKRRLNLLFKSDYILDIQQTPDKYQIKLKMPLHDKMPDS